MRVREEVNGEGNDLPGGGESASSEGWMDDVLKDEGAATPVEDTTPLADGEPPDGQVKDDKVVGSVTPPAPKPDPAPVAAPASTTAPAPAPTPAPAVPAPAPTPVAEVQPPQPTEEERRVQVETQRKQIAEKLEAHYALSEDDARDVIAEPEKVIPRLLAKAHMAAMADAQAIFRAQLPALISHYQESSKVQSGAADSFFKAWPELGEAAKDEAVGKRIASVVVGYRQANPTLSTEEIIHQAGLAAIVSLKLPIPPRVMAGHNVDTPNATKPAVHAPAGGSAPAPSGVAPQSQNTFEVMANEDINNQ